MVTCSRPSILRMKSSNEILFRCKTLTFCSRSVDGERELCNCNISKFFRFPISSGGSVRSSASFRPRSYRFCSRPMEGGSDASFELYSTNVSNLVRLTTSSGSVVRYSSSFRPRHFGFYSHPMEGGSDASFELYSTNVSNLVRFPISSGSSANFKSQRFNSLRLVNLPMEGGSDEISEN